MYGYTVTKYEYMGYGVSQPYASFVCLDCAETRTLDNPQPLTQEDVDFFFDRGEYPMCEYCLKEIGRDGVWHK